MFTISIFGNGVEHGGFCMSTWQQCNVGLFWTTSRVGPPALLEILATGCQNILSWIGNYFCLSLVKTIMPHVTCLIKIARPYKLPFQSIRTSSKCCLALREYPPLNLPPTKIWLAIIIANVCVDINCRLCI